MEKILIVDDERDITQYCEMYLKQQGYDVKGAVNSEQAFAALETFNPDILILDINLREKYTGFDVLKKALQLNPQAKAVMLTGYGEDILLNDSLRQGARQAIVKPITVEKLLEVIKSL
ncbi:MAG: response regulator [Candidatus Omnitrophica bacterium]|nr:response regulator [Candidatus Omnitrophota bacterium]